MAIIRRALGPAEARSSRSRAMPRVGAASTSAGISVDPERSLQIASVYACVRLLSEAVAGLPTSMYRRLDDRREPVPSHPILDLVTYEPNPVLDGQELWRTIIGWMALRGNGYAYIERDGNGRPKALWPLKPSSVGVKRRSTGELAYELNPDDDEWIPRERGTIVGPEFMLHFRAFGLGVEGLSPIGLARQNVGIAFAAQQYLGGFYARDATPGGVLQTDGELTDAQFERLSAQWRELHEGWSNSYRMALLEGGAKWVDTTLSPADAQFIETQKFSRDEIASIYGVPPHMIGATEKSTSWGSGIAEQGIGFVKYSLRPWIQRLERVTTRRLLLGEDKNLRLRWNPDGLMQGDLKARYDAYAVGKQWGWLSTNDVRRLEDESPVEGGDVYLQPLNMVPAGQVPVAPNARSRKGAPARRDAQRDRWVEVHAAELTSLMEEQRQDVLDALGTLDRDKWDGLLAELLTKQALEVVEVVGDQSARALGGAFDLGLAGAFVAAMGAQRARNLNITTETQLASALSQAEDVAAAVDGVFDEATNTRAQQAAESYVDHSQQFARHEGGKQAGATRKKWVVTSKNPRPSHARMNGTEVGIDEVFPNGAMWPGDNAAGVDETAGCTCEVQIIA